MANIGSLVVDLRTNSAAFVAEMEKARVATERTARGIDGAIAGASRAFSLITRVAGAVGIALSVQALIESGRRAIEAAGGLGELAEQVGLTTQAYQELRFGAVASGVTMEQFEAAMIRLNDTLGNAARGNDEAIDSFRRLGVNILDSAGNLRPTEAILNDVADALQRIDDPARRAAAANDLFGRAGARLLPLLSQGADGLRANAVRARELGGVIDDNLISAADRLADRWAQMGLVMQNRTAEWALFIMDKLGQLADFVRSVADELARRFPQLFGTAVQAASSRVADLRAQLETVRGELARLTTPGPNQPRGSAIPGVVARERQREADLVAQIAAAEAAAQAARDAARIRADTENFQTPARPQRAAPGESNPTGAAAGRSRAAAIDREAEAFDRLLRSIDPAYKAIREYEDARATLDAGLARGSLTVAEHGERVEQLNAQYNQAAKSALGVADGAARATDRTGELIQAFEGFGRSSAKTIADMVVGLDQANLSIGRIIQTLASGILEKLIYERITGPLTRAAGGFLDNLLGSAFGLFGGKSAAFAGVPAGVTAVAVGHGGGVGRELGRSRAADAMAFVGAPRFHAGKAPWGPGEMPAIIRPEETVLTPGQMRALGPRSDVVVNIIDQRGAGSAPVETRETSGPNGERMIDVFIADRVNRNADNGGLDRAMQRNFGIARAPARRS